MGSDKARLPLRGWPAAVRIAEVLEGAGLSAFLVRREPDGLPWMFPDGRTLPVVYEGPKPERHPLHGVVAALEHAGGPVIVVPCDVVQLDVPTVTALLRGPAVATGERDHPLVAHLRFEHLARARSLVPSGRAMDLVEGLPRVQVDGHALVDRNRLEGPSPFERLCERVGLGGAAGTRAAVAEQHRQRSRGVVCPGTNRYALAAFQGEGE